METLPYKDNAAVSPLNPNLPQVNRVVIVVVFVVYITVMNAFCFVHIAGALIPLSSIKPPDDTYIMSSGGLF